nr:glutathione S-transferase family protein [Marinicella sp. W31]MDC2876904.1 glutathione S-transferase family protein [Marinicella sp. W31]
MGTLDFYTNPQSRGRMARWMLEESGAAYETHILTYGGTMKSESYLKINPMGKVPTIVHDGKVVTECAAICAYLADAFPEAALAPALNDRAAYYRWLFFAAGPLEASISNKTFGFEVPAERERAIGYGTFENVMYTLDKRLTESPYIAGNHFTAADVYVGSQIVWGLQFKTIGERPSFQAYSERLASREAFIRAHQLDDAATEAS